ncbi:MAG: nucleotidyltransferase domain-containing protein [Aquisalimonadaceae bacterium]
MNDLHNGRGYRRRICLGLLVIKYMNEMRYNQITFPGGPLARILRAVIKGKPMYELPAPLGEQKSSSEKSRILVSISEKAPMESVAIKAMFHELNKFSDVVSVYIHGSYADETTTSFSDIDDYIIVEEARLTNKRFKSLIIALNKIDMRFCRADPLQHHGHWITSVSELGCYDNSFLPLFVLGEAKHVLGRNGLEAKVDMASSRRGLCNNIGLTCEIIVLLFQKMRNNSINAYELKCLVGSVALMPAYVFQYLGEELSKPDAIKRAKEIYSSKSLEVIDWATQCRKNWIAVTGNTRFRFFSILPRLFCNPYVWRRTARSIAPKLTEKQLREMTDIVLIEGSVLQFVRESRVVIENGHA